MVNTFSLNLIALIELILIAQVAIIISGGTLNKKGVFLSGVFMFMLVLIVVFRFIIISDDVSLDKKIWFNSISKHKYDKGDYVLININDERIRYNKIIKQVACIEGDTVRITDDIVYCNDMAIAKLLKEDKQGKPLYPFTKDNETVIPKDYYFLVGTDERSYDSRYFGLVYINGIITVVKPIL